MPQLPLRVPQAALFQVPTCGEPAVAVKRSLIKPPLYLGKACVMLFLMPRRPFSSLLRSVVRGRRGVQGLLLSCLGSFLSSSLGGSFCFLSSLSACFPARAATKSRHYELISRTTPANPLCAGRVIIIGGELRLCGVGAYCHHSCISNFFLRSYLVLPGLRFVAPLVPRACQAHRTLKRTCVPAAVRVGCTSIQDVEFSSPVKQSSNTQNAKNYTCHKKLPQKSASQILPARRAQV